ncbi:MAG: YIP1 family protein [Nitrospirae bacterium]|nr:YIP1 family protein [Nitrospirota bacterium]
MDTFPAAPDAGTPSLLLSGRDGDQNGQGVHAPPPWDSPAPIDPSGPKGSSFVRRTWEDWAGALFSPRVFFRDLRSRTSIKQALVFGIVLNAAGSLLSFPVSLLRWKSSLAMLEQDGLSRFSFLRQMLQTADSDSFLKLGAYLYHGGSILLSPITVPLFYLGLAMTFIHPTARLLGGKGTFVQTVIALTYTSATQPLLLLGILPFFGYGAYLFYTTLLATIAVREAHQFSTGQSLVSLGLGGVVAPFVLLIITLVLVVLLITGGSAGQLLETFQAA